MSRMKLHQSVRLGAYEIYPIYELNFTELKELTGYTLNETNDNVSPDANKFRRWTLVNNDIPSHTDYFPRQSTENGNILPCDTRYNNLINDRYYMPHDTLESFAAIEQGVQPEDWGVNPNYVVLNNITQSFNDSPSGGYGDVNVCVPEPVNIYDTWDNSTSYYEDTKRFLVRKFFLEDGKSFSVSKAGYYNSDRWCGISFGNGTLTSFRSGWNGYDNRYIGYYFTRSDGTVINKDYKAEHSYGITGIANNPDRDWPTWQNGKNITQFFIHYVENGTTDFYGIAMAQMDNFLETASPIALEVVAFDAQWWGASIIAGGGGSGQWTTDGPTSYVQGGRGKFHAPSDNRGEDPQDAHNIVDGYVDRYNSNIAPLYGGYNQYVVDKTDWRPMTEMMAQLWDPDLLDSWNNSMMNPLTAIVTCHFMPERLCPIPNSSVDRIQVLNRYLSTNEAKKYTNPIKHEVIGEVDINSYFEGFPDYEGTNVYIYLPYIGTYQLDIEAVMEGQLAVDYTADAYTGDCLAWIWTKDRFGNSQLRYTFKGNCAKPMYLASVVGAGAQRIGIIAQTAVNVGSQAIANKMMSKSLSKYWQPSYDEDGNLVWNRSDSVNPLAPAITGQTIGSGINSFLNAGAKVTQGNASTGVISVPIDTQCYLIITRPQWSAPEEYGKQFGYPSDIGGTINQSDTEGGDPFTNFLAVRSIRLDGLAATDDEKAEIEALMVAGVFTTND